MDIEQMRMVLALAESKNMTMTAKRLQLTQPALTYRIKTIESELGFPVFTRSHAGTEPTPEGAFLCETLRKVVDEYDEAVRLSRAMATGLSMDTIRVGTNASSRDTISAFLRIAQGSFTTQAFSLISCGKSNPLTLLDEGIIDFWSTSDVALQATDRTDLRFLKLAETTCVAYVPVQHRLANADIINLEDLAGESIWMWAKGKVSQSSDLLREELAKRKIEADIQDFAAGTSAMLAPLAGARIAIYDTGYLPPPLHIARQVPLAWEPIDQLGLVYREDKAEQLQCAIQELEDHIANERDGVQASEALKAGRIITVLDDIVDTICRGGMRDIVPLVDYALELGAPPSHVLNRGVLAGIDAASELFKSGATYNAEMLAAVATSNLASEELQPLIDSQLTKRDIGTAVIGTMQGDRHNVGKNLVRIALEGRGIEVEDLGIQVAPQDFVKYVRDHPHCNLVLISLYRTEVRDKVKATIQALEDAGLRSRVFIMLGGPAADAQFADEAGADAFTIDATEAARTAASFLSY